jgi:hypothetical protein
MQRSGSWLVAAVIVCMLFLAGVNALAQGGNAQLGGIVEDESKAVIPGVTITARNLDTNVSLSQISNESGAYSFPVLQPGTYEVAAELPGFKRSVQTDVRLSYAGQVRINFTLQVGAATDSVEVSVAADSILRDSSASVGDVLTQDKIEALPLVGNNILDLLDTMPGLRLNPFFDSGAFDTVNGLGMNSVNMTRDGLSTVDVRNYPELYGRRTLSNNVILPDLVGEIRLVVSPVDAEIGRGNAQVQVRTRSGTNQYRGSTTWNVRNSALDANTWTNNHTPYVDPISGERSNSTRRDWFNNHQYTVSIGGPVQIPKVYDGKNKTFFYTLWDQNIQRRRQTFQVNVLTDTARQGIFRYWSGYNPVGWNPSEAAASPTFPLNAANASYIAVDQLGNPVRPPANPTSPTLDPGNPLFQPYTGSLICFSVFGTQRLDPGGRLVPFTQNDCPGGSAVLPTGRSAWDNFRTSFDSSGMVQKWLQTMPKANYFGSGDGLNIAQLRWRRGRYGDNQGNSLVGTSDFVNRKQINIKIDHNFNANHKVAVGYTTQWDHSESNCGFYPDTICGEQERRPHTITVNATSTLSSRMVNEARFGDNYSRNFEFAAWDNPNPAIADRAKEFLLPAGSSIQNPDFRYLAIVQSVAGNVGAAGSAIQTAPTIDLNRQHLWNFADTLSYSRGKHGFKFGADWRLPRTTGNGRTQPYPSITLGAAPGGVTPTPFANLANFNTATDSVGYLPGLLNAAATGTGVTATRTNVANLLYYLNGSVSGVTQNYWITSSDNRTNGYWDDISTNGLRLRQQINQELALFVKDDYKVTRRLTLNLGVRWEYYSSPYIDGGFTTSVLGYGYGAFGATRAAQGTLDQFKNDPFSLFLRPGNLYLTGYGSSAANPLSCQRGVKQNALLPESTCDPNALSVIDFVGSGTPNPNVMPMPENYANIGPAIGFAYSIPWFGEGKTTIRGGYQQTFGSAGQNRTTIGGGTEQVIGNSPGATTTGTLANAITDPVFQNIVNSGRAINLGDIQSLVPMRPNQRTPGAALPIYGRSFNPAVYDPNLQTPYTQNLNLSITRQINNKYTVDVRYTGTLGRKQMGNLNINQNNVYYNPELFQALTDARAATCTPDAPGYAGYRAQGINPCNINGDPVLFDQLLAGLNPNNTVPGFGAVGTVVNGIYQSGAQHLRRNAAFQNNLSWGNFAGVADSLVTLATGTGYQALPINPATGGQLGGISQRALRNGCDRMGNGFSIVQQTTAGGNQVANTGAAIPLRCFPEDWLTANPQFGTITYITNTARSNYHALQAQVTARPTPGSNVSATWIWAKSLNLPGSGYIDPSNRNLNYAVQSIAPHSLRMNGTVELPIGPGKPFFGSSSGWMARSMERWQVGFIFNAATGTPQTFNPGISHFYAASGYEIASTNWKLPKPRVEWPEGSLTGTMYPGNPYINVPDPQCSDPSVVAGADRMGTNLQGVCTISALAARNPDGTPGELLLKYPMPGQTGNLGRGNITYFGVWSLDMNASKTFKVTETTNFQLRVDARNVMNHPGLAIPSLSAGSLGLINGKGNQTRQFQGQLRINF